MGVWLEGTARMLVVAAVVTAGAWLRSLLNRRNDRHRGAS